MEKPCNICGDKRYFSWAPFNYDQEKTPVDQHYETDEPLAEFTNWILHYFKIKPKKKQKKSRKNNPAENTDKTAKEKQEEKLEIPTHCYAHNGDYVNIKINFFTSF